MRKKVKDDEEQDKVGRGDRERLRVVRKKKMREMKKREMRE